MMYNIPPRRNYADLRNEIKNTSNPELLQKMALKLLHENEQLAQENKKKHSALDQIHLLVHQLYLTLQNKMSETRLLKKCMAMLQNTHDFFLKDFLEYLGSLHEEFQKIPSNLPHNLHIGFLTRTLNSVTTNLTMTKVVVKHYIDNYRIYDCEFSEKPNLEECLGLIKKAVMLITKVYKSFHSTFEGSDGSNINRRRKRGDNSVVNKGVKRRKLQEVNGDSGFVKYTNGNRKIVQIMLRNNSQMNVDLSDQSSKQLVVKLIDVLSDPVAECDLDVLHYKQTNLLKDNEDNEYKVLDDVGATSEEEETVSNDQTNPVDSETYIEHEPCNSSSELNMDDASNSGSDAHSEGEENEEQESTSVRSYNCDDDVETKAQASQDTDQEKDGSLHSGSFVSPSGSDSDFDDDADDSDN